MYVGNVQGAKWDAWLGMCKELDDWDAWLGMCKELDGMRG